MEKKIQVKCVKDVVMKCSEDVVMKNGEIAYIEGKTYDAIQDGITIKAKDEQGFENHYINSKSLAEEDWFDKYFVIVFNGESILPENVRELLENEKRILEICIGEIEERLKHRRKQLLEDEERLEKGKKDLEGILKVLKGR